jgi:hypothetical protein
MPTTNSNIAQIVVAFAFGDGPVSVEFVSAHLPDRDQRLVCFQCEVGDNDSAAEWDALDTEAMSSDRIDAVAEYLRSTGQASA